MKGLYYEGAWQEPHHVDIIEVENPIEQQVAGRVTAASQQDVDRAVSSAKKAFPSWSQLDLQQRKDYISKLLELLTRDQEILAEIIRSELGCGPDFARRIQVKPYLDDIQNYLHIVDDFPREEVHESYVIYREAQGVVACLTPWNYPLGQIAKKLIPALLMGNTVLLKPSQKTPLVAVKLVELIHEAGFPKGVVNLLCGRGREVGNVLALHPDVDMITFTGSTQGGREVALLAQQSLKRVILELGGKSAAVILPGANLDIALKKTLDKVYLNTGQTCSAYTRLLVPEDMKAEVEAKILEKTQEYPFGSPQAKESTIGPLSSRQQFEKVRDYIELGLQEGAKLLLGEVPQDRGDYYVGPTVFTEVDNSMRIAQEEIFGPVLSVIFYKDVQEALELANDSIYGLSGGVFGEDQQAMDFAKKLRTGTIVVNDGAQMHKAPFGGFKQSGYGREGGAEGLRQFTEVKTIFVPSKFRRK